MRQQNNVKIMKYFSRQMASKRTQKNMSQGELSEIVDCHINTINNIECGRSSPNFEMALKLSKVLDISLDQMIKEVLKDLDL
jgi:transcriptional regulator with XRE-family HTH domain